MKNQQTQEDLFNKAKEVLDQANKAVVKVLIHREKIVSKLFGNWEKEQLEYIKPEIINPRTFRDALTLSWLNGDIDTHFHKTFIKLLDAKVYDEAQLDMVNEFLYS